LRFPFSLFIGLVSLSSMYAQKKADTAYILTPAQVTELFPDTVRKSLHIDFPIYRVYQYTDKAGQYYCILTENLNERSTGNDSLFSQIRAINVRSVKGAYTIVWEMNDHIIKADLDENSIWFWTKYLDFKDIDGDGLADPVVVYGTSVESGPYDGRVKMIIYYRGKKIAIRHQNGDLDYLREIQIERAFYRLPRSLQTAIVQKMELIMKNGNALFPYGWQAAMKNGKTTINERK
jgi:hypothetical protein